ncbi:MAG: acyl-CoA dehydrogenase [Sphingopyxis sp.]|nr:acyl-CoA dehydrogenase [Sphingopyxis sp.]
MAQLDLPLAPAQQMLLDSVQRFLADVPRPGWRRLADGLELGGVAVPEAAGGFGGRALDIALVAAELGPALAGADWLSHTAAAFLIGEIDPGHPVLQDLATGNRRAALICPASTAAMPSVEPRGGGWSIGGEAALVAGGAEADLFLLADPAAILLVPAAHDRIDQRHRVMLDDSVTADVGFALAPAEVEPLATGARAAQLAAHITDVMLAARCAEAVGLIQRMLAEAAGYLRQRRQFGSAIGSFQALRHRIADMQIAAMKAGALTEVAIVALDGDEATRAAAVSGACVEVADAVRVVGEGAVQMHGAMGLTEELALGRYFKRALAIAAALGPQAGHLARFAETAD